jgi:O-acetyl-ADP-ribose deacetylase (regulator of RNase III)
MITEIEGSLFDAAQNAEVDVIVHCCNCFCTQGKGIALQMAKSFSTNEFELENKEYEADIKKLGQIDYKIKRVSEGKSIWVINAYGQYHWKDPSPYGIPLDYDALTLCFRKINKEFKGYKIGLPYLPGGGLAKGNHERIKQIIASEFKDCEVFIYNLKAK